MSERFPFPAFPEGWFQVAYGREVGPGEVLSLHYFGEQLICFRDSAGAKPQLASGESAVTTFRRWAEQSYPLPAAAV